MSRERELLERAVGVQPPVTLDFDAIEAAGGRAVRRRGRWVVGGAVVAVGLVAVGVVGVVARAAVPRVVPGGAPVTAAPTVRGIAYCYKTADISSTEIDQHLAVGVSDGDAAGAIREICADIWAGKDHQWSDRGSLVPPRLVACVLNSDAVGVEAGAVGVFPGDALSCSRMGMADADV